MNITTPVRKFRIASKVSPDEVASALQLSLYEYDDLENKYSELYMQLSLAQIKRLVNILNTTYVDFFELPNDLSIFVSKKTFENLHTVLHQRLQAWPAIKSELRWDVDNFMRDSNQAFDWNLYELRDVCSALGLYWPAYLLG